MWNFPLFPEQASKMASKVDAIFFYGLALTLFFITFVMLLFLTFLTRYRRGTKVNRDNPLTHSSKMETLLIGSALVMFLSLFVWGAIIYFEAYDAPGESTDVYVVGKQWMWYLQHPEGKREINELHIPVGRPVKLKMTSQDVIHSFFVPAYRAKQDVLPGRYTQLWFTPTKPGKYHLFCTEYCGTNHSQMGGWVYAMEPADYERWLAVGADGLTMAKEGEALFVKHHCSGCHNGSQAVRAPMLNGVYGTQVPIQDGQNVRFVRADDRYIRDSILLPKSEGVAGYEPLMPSYQGIIPEEDLVRIIEYIKSLGTAEPVVTPQAPQPEAMR